nr:acyl-CoA thioesterase [uncultured Merdimonas sp.]
MGEQKAYQHKVQYYETDQMGIVHHSNYIRWFEEARTNYMECLGIGYETMEAQGILSPVLSVSAEYLRMVHFGDVVTIDCYIKEYNGIKLTLVYEVILNKTGMVHCRGTSRHCFINREGRPLSLKHSAPEFHEMFMRGRKEGQSRLEHLTKNPLKKKKS